MTEENFEIWRSFLIHMQICGYKWTNFSNVEWESGAPTKIQKYQMQLCPTKHALNKNQTNETKYASQNFNCFQLDLNFTSFILFLNEITNISSIYNMNIVRNFF